MDGYSWEQGAFFPEVEDFLDWLDLQTLDTLHSLGEFLLPLVHQLESYAALMPQALRQRVLLKLRLLCP